MRILLTKLLYSTLFICHFTFCSKKQENSPASANKHIYILSYEAQGFGTQNFNNVFNVYRDGKKIISSPNVIGNDYIPSRMLILGNQVFVVGSVVTRNNGFSVSAAVFYNNEISILADERAVDIAKNNQDVYIATRSFGNNASSKIWKNNNLYATFQESRYQLIIKRILMVNKDVYSLVTEDSINRAITKTRLYKNTEFISYVEPPSNFNINRTSVLGDNIYFDGNTVFVAGLLENQTDQKNTFFSWKNRQMTTYAQGQRNEIVNGWSRIFKDNNDFYFVTTTDNPILYPTPTIRVWKNNTLIYTSSPLLGGLISYGGIYLNNNKLYIAGATQTLTADRRNYILSTMFVDDSGIINVLSSPNNTTSFAVQILVQ